MDEELIKIAYDILSELFSEETSDARAMQIQRWLVRNINYREIDEALGLHFDQVVNDGCFVKPPHSSFRVVERRPDRDVPVMYAAGCKPNNPS